MAKDLLDLSGIKTDIEISMKVEESTSTLAKRMTEAIVEELNGRLRNAARGLKRNVGAILVEALKSQPEYASIIGGQLREEFGIPDGASKLNDILQAWAQTVTVMVKPFTTTGQTLGDGGIRVEAVRSSFEDVLELPSAYQLTEKGEELPWLRWLLLEGDRVIIREYIISDAGKVRGRAGGKIMRVMKSGSWSVPVGFRGNELNNWTTRAIDAAETQFQEILEKGF